MKQIYTKRLWSEDCCVGLSYQWKEDYTGEFSSIELIENEYELKQIKIYIDDGEVEYYWIGK